MAPSLDTNCLLRWVLNDVPEQAERVVALLAANEVTVSDHALTEFVYVLSAVYKVDRPEIVAVLQLILSESSFNLDRQLWTGVIESFSTHPKLSVTDILLIEQARKSGSTPAYTFDKKLAAQMPDATLVP